MTLDRMRFLVVSQHQSGPIIWEVELSSMDQATVAKDIRDGQYGDVLHVIEFNPVEHICREVTREFEGLTRFDRELAEAQRDPPGGAAMKTHPRDVPLPPAEEENLTRLEACRVARITTSTFDRAVSAQRLRVNRTGRKVTVKRAELDRFMGADA